VTIFRIEEPRLAVQSMGVVAAPLSGGPVGGKLSPLTATPALRQRRLDAAQAARRPQSVRAPYAHPAKMLQIARFLTRQGIYNPMIESASRSLEWSDVPTSPRSLDHLKLRAALPVLQPVHTEQATPSARSFEVGDLAVTCQLVDGAHRAPKAFGDLLDQQER
jgi:hypothetical protein